MGGGFYPARKKRVGLTRVFFFFFCPALWCWVWADKSVSCKRENLFPAFRQERERFLFYVYCFLIALLYQKAHFPSDVLPMVQRIPFLQVQC